MTSQSTTFEDHFSSHSEKYAQSRPQYPEEIYAFLASLAPSRSLAWDCGTGSGQAAIGLAKYFDRVYATDASAEQISHAYQHEKVTYHAEPAEGVSLHNASADLVTVAVAIHWFNFDEFYAEVKRVLKPEGILAVWTYNAVEISAKIDALIWRYYRDIVGEAPPDDPWRKRFRAQHLGRNRRVIQIERDAHLIYNVAVLLAPDGKVAGKYRKVALPRSEIAGGITPGNAVRVFPTDVGNVGLLIGHDTSFSEPARCLRSGNTPGRAWRPVARMPSAICARAPPRSSRSSSTRIAI